MIAFLCIVRSLRECVLRSECFLQVCLCHEPGAANFDGRQKFSLDPAPNRPDRHAGESGNLDGTEVFRSALHRCLSGGARDVAGARSASGSLTAHSRAAWRARRRTISISAAGAELSTFVLVCANRNHLAMEMAKKASTLDMAKSNLFLAAMRSSLQRAKTTSRGGGLQIDFERLA